MSTGRTSTIGPYRLEDRLGAGGMGEVWRAWDERLHRSVAIKLIRPESAEDQIARERLRREARAAAALNHPAVVRIYDIVESGEGDAIVMELVEGELMSRRIAQGPLPVEETVRLGRQIAEGLAAAHRRGILHRDLKAENVIVTPEGETKILDFGLAKRMDAEAEASLTRSAAVIGTVRSMSPEQARGMALDPRSDLFSFGVLLYEMLTGVSPFKAESTTDTLMRICTLRQRPVRDLRIEVPEGLSELVDHLLEKDPAFRPQNAGELVSELERVQSLAPPSFLSSDQPTLIEPVAPALLARSLPAITTFPSLDATRPSGRARRLWLPAVVVLVTALAPAVWFMGRHRSEPLYVAVLKPEVQQGNDIAGVEAMAAGLRSSLLSGLLSLEGMHPLPPEQVDPISGSPREVGRATAAGEVVASQLSCGTQICQISIHRLRGQDGVLLWEKTLSVPLERPYLLVDALYDSLAQGYSDRRPRGDQRRLAVREADYTEYLRLYLSFDTRRGEEFSAGDILDRLARIRKTSPRFLEVSFLETAILLQRFRTGRERRDLERVYGVLEQSRKLAPHDPRPVFSLFEAALLGENLEHAETALGMLERMQPGDARLLANRARLLDRQGHSEKALELMRQATELLPSWRHLFWLADMEYRQGRIAEARTDLRELLRRSPGNSIGESLLAQLELLNGDPKQAAEIYGRLVRRSPQFTYLANLGTAQLLLGLLPQAEQSFRRAVELEPANPFVLLNLADTRLLLGDRHGADDLYQRTLRLAEKDPTAGSNWQISSVRAQAFAHLNRKEEAVAAVQEALRLAPKNPQVAFEASLVYAILGDEASALFNAKRALDQGVEPRWLDLPWFDSLRPNLTQRDARSAGQVAHDP